MDIKKKAQEYAKEKIQQVLNDAIAEAYMEGYKQGYEDGAAKLAVKRENDDIEFVDLSLPSGTLWAKDFVKKEGGSYLFLTYNKAKFYKLPTEENIKELFQECEHTYTSGGWGNPPKTEFIGPNGNVLLVWHEGFHKAGRHSGGGTVWFWILNDNSIHDSRLNAAYCDDEKQEITTLFSGFELPVMLIK